MVLFVTFNKVPSLNEVTLELPFTGVGVTLIEPPVVNVPELLEKTNASLRSTVLFKVLKFPKG